MNAPKANSGNTEALKARARLALRAERALGLTMVPAAVATVTVAEKLTQPAAAPAPGRAAAPKSAAAVSTSTDLFGTPASTTSSKSGSASLLSIVPSAFTTAPLSREEKISHLNALNQNQIHDCKLCRLSERRTNTVFGEGDADAKIFFIGEGPGENEDLQGRPFVGRAGELLNKWIAAMGLRREQVYIANIVKCRPPDNREPAPDEVATCTPFLTRQIEIIRPEVIITLGRPASQHMLQTKISMGKMRGQWHEWRAIKLMPTYHPAYVLRNYSYETRAAVWNDLQLVMKELGLPLPPRRAN